MSYTYTIKQAQSVIPNADWLMRDYIWYLVTAKEIDPNTAVVLDIPPLISLDIGLGQGDYVAITLSSGLTVMYAKTKPLQFRTGTP